MDVLRACLWSADFTIMRCWHQICETQEQEKRVWIESLRRQGATAAHPDDGWVDRERSEVTLTYPQFDDGCSVGATIALGWPDRYRLVRITGRRETMFGVICWPFEEFHDAHRP